MLESYLRSLNDIWWLWVCTLGNITLTIIHTNYSETTERYDTVTSAITVGCIFVTQMIFTMYDRKRLKRTTVLFVCSVIQFICVITLLYTAIRYNVAGVLALRVTFIIQPALTLSIVRAIKEK